MRHKCWKTSFAWKEKKAHFKIIVGFVVSLPFTLLKPIFKRGPFYTITVSLFCLGAKYVYGLVSFFYFFLIHNFIFLWIISVVRRGGRLAVKEIKVRDLWVLCPFKQRGPAISQLDISCLETMLLNGKCPNYMNTLKNISIVIKRKEENC